MSPISRVRPGLLIAIAATLVLVCCGGGVVAFFLNASDDVSDQAGGCGSGAAINVDAKFPNVGSLGPDQMRNAAIIISVGQQLKVPPRGWVIAIATALQESRLRNLPNLDEPTNLADVDVPRVLRIAKKYGMQVGAESDQA